MLGQLGGHGDSQAIDDSYNTIILAVYKNLMNTPVCVSKNVKFITLRMRIS